MQNWSISNLSLQKMLYLAHMYHLGRTGVRLAAEPFEAWDYGPVSPPVYRRAKIFGRDPVRDGFDVSAPPVTAGTAEHASIEEVVRELRGRSAADLVAITHQPQSAWAKCYIPGATGIVIPDEEIVAEYNARRARAA